MNIKSLLLGSAAALAVVSGAQAADAVVAAEPEPMEYVRVCDAYGTGFFYIPGTETCLKFGGKIRFDKAVIWQDGRNGVTGKKNGEYKEWHTRGYLDVEAKNDSEWGTVYSWMRVRGDSTNNVTSTSVYYFAGIGGFEFGAYDSPGTKFHGYTTGTINDGHYADEWDRQYVSYTFTFDGFSAYIAAENDMQNGSNYHTVAGFDAALNPVYNNNQNDGGDEFMPDISGGVKGKFGDWEAGAFVGYDESDESFNLRKWIRGDLGMFSVTAFGLYSDSINNSFWHYDGFSALVGASAKVTDTVTLNKTIQWYDNDSWMVAANVSWAMAPGFQVTVEGSYADGKEWGNQAVSGAIIRIDRNF
jgi:hypothetical protein